MNTFSTSRNLDDLTSSLGRFLDYLKTCLAKFEEGQHGFRNSHDLDCVELTHKLKNILPFYPMPDGINNTHHREYSAQLKLQINTRLNQKIITLFS